MLLGDYKRHGHLGRRLLHRVHKAGENVYGIEVPHRKAPRLVEHEHNKCAEGRKRVAHEHRFFLAEAVCQRSRKNAHDHVRRICADRERRGAQGRARRLVQPQRERKCGNAAAQLRQTLRTPKYVEIF